MTAFTRSLGSPQPDQQACVIGRLTRGGHAHALATAANAAAMDNPAARFFVDEPAIGSYAVSYTRTPNTAFLRIEWWLHGLQVAQRTAGGSNTSVSLSITDGTSTATTSLIPAGFQGEVQVTPGRIGSQFALALGARADLDLVALAAELSASNDWVLTFTVTLVGSGQVARIQGYELPRWLGDDAADGRGMPPGDFLPQADIDNNATTGLPRIVATLASARTMPQARYLTLTWADNSSSGSCPTTLSTTDAPLGNASEDATHPVLWYARTRPITPRSVVGAPFRWRIRYSTQTGTTFTFTLHTGSSTSPYTVTFPDTTSGWVWSAWQAGRISTATKWDALSFTGFVGTAGKQAWVSGIEVEATEP